MNMAGIPLRGMALGTCAGRIGGPCGTLPNTWEWDPRSFYAHLGQRVLCRTGTCGQRLGRGRIAGNHHRGSQRCTCAFRTIVYGHRERRSRRPEIRTASFSCVFRIDKARAARARTARRARSGTVFRSGAFRNSAIFHMRHHMFFAGRPSRRGNGTSTVHMGMASRATDGSTVGRALGDTAGSTNADIRTSSAFDRTARRTNEGSSKRLAAGPSIFRKSKHTHAVALRERTGNAGSERRKNWTRPSPTAEGARPHHRRRSE